MARVLAKMIGGPEDGNYWSTDENTEIVYGLNAMDIDNLADDGLPIERYTKQGTMRDITNEEHAAGLDVNNEIGVCEFFYTT